jgi:hypothetical protein
MSVARVVGVATAVLLAGCGGASADPDVGPIEIAELTDEVAAAESPIATTVLFGTATQVDGTDFDLASLQGSDLVVWFWAPW